MIKSTIMIPAYNVGRFLPQTLESVFNQINNDTEVLLVDDGSIDDTQEIARRFERLYPQMRVLNQKNQGTGPTRNRLIEESRGEILFGLDADDLLHPSAIEEVTRVFQGNPEVGFIYTDQIEIDESGKVTGRRNRSSCDRFFDDLIYHCHFPGHLRAFRRSSLRGTRFNNSLNTGEDWDFLLSIYPFTKRLHIPEKLYSYRINPKGISITEGDKTVRESILLLGRFLRIHNVYPNQECEIIPIDAGNNIIYYDHLIKGKSTMKPAAREVLEKYLREGC